MHSASSMPIRSSNLIVAVFVNDEVDEAIELAVDHGGGDGRPDFTPRLDRTVIRVRIMADSPTFLFRRGVQPLYRRIFVRVRQVQARGIAAEGNDSCSRDRSRKLSVS